MADFVKEAIVEKAAKKATYRYLLGKLIYDSTPQALKDKILEKVDMTQFIISAGTLAEEKISLEEFTKIMDDMKASYQAGEDVDEVGNTGKTLPNDKFAKILEIAGFIQATVNESADEGVQAYMEAIAEDGEIQTEMKPEKTGDGTEDNIGIDNIILSKEPPESITNIINDEDFGNFTEEIVMKITNDLRDDKIATDLDTQESNNITASIEDENEDEELQYEDGDSLLEDDENDTEEVEDLDNEEGTPEDQTPEPTPPAEDATDEEKQLYQEACAAKKKKKSKKKPKKVAYIDKIKKSVAKSTEKLYKESPFDNLMKHSPDTAALPGHAVIAGVGITLIGPLSIAAVLIGATAAVITNKFITMPLMDNIITSTRKNGWDKVINEYITISTNSKIKNDKVLIEKYIKPMSIISKQKSVMDNFKYTDCLIKLTDAIKFGGLGREESGIKMKEILEKTPKGEVADKLASMSDEFDVYITAIREGYMSAFQTINVLLRMNGVLKRYIISDEKSFGDFVANFREYDFYKDASILEEIVTSLDKNVDIIKEFETRYHK